MLIVEVIIPLLNASSDWLIRLAVVVTPLTIDVRVLTADSSELELIKLAVVVEVLPLTIDVRVNELVEVETDNIFVEPLSIMDCKSVVVDRPFIVDTSIVPDADKEWIIPDCPPTPLGVLLVVVELEGLISIVFLTPFISIDNCPDIIEYKLKSNGIVVVAIIPLILDNNIDEAVLPSNTVLNSLVLIIFTLLELDPPTLEESVLLDEVRVLLVLRLVTFRLFVVKLVVVASVAVRLIVLVVVAVIVSVKRLVKYPVTLLNILEKKLEEEEFMKLELVEERLLDVKLFVVRLLVNRLLRERSDPCILEMIVEVETSMLGMREGLYRLLFEIIFKIPLFIKVWLSIILSVILALFICELSITAEPKYPIFDMLTRLFVGVCK